MTYQDNETTWLPRFALAIFGVDVNDLWPDNGFEVDDIITHMALVTAYDNHITSWDDWNRRVLDNDYIPLVTEYVVKQGLGENDAWVAVNASTVVQTVLSRAAGRNPAGVAVRL